MNNKLNNGTLVFFNPNTSDKLQIEVDLGKGLFTLRTEKYPITYDGLKMILQSLEEYHKQYSLKAEVKAKLQRQLEDSNFIEVSWS